jgi:hypothetical protein
MQHALVKEETETAVVSLEGMTLGMFEANSVSIHQMLAQKLSTHPDKLRLYPVIADNTSDVNGSGWKNDGVLLKVRYSVTREVGKPSISTIPLCLNNQFRNVAAVVSSTGLLQQHVSCTNYSECSLTQYQSIPPSLVSDRECRVVSTCDIVSQ